MKVLWELGPANVQTVRKAVAPKRKLAYTTVQTVLNLMYRKRKVDRTLENRAYVYFPRVSRREETGLALDDVIDRLFGGSAESLVLSLVENERLSPQELERLKRLVEPSESEKS